VRIIDGEIEIAFERRQRIAGEAGDV